MSEFTGGAGTGVGRKLKNQKKRGKSLLLDTNSKETNRPEKENAPHLSKERNKENAAERGRAKKGGGKKKKSRIVEKQNLVHPERKA